jgi:NADPH-dependent 2,4-dienoyl-CoA reductase/sulfur reductase-like enzyme
VPPPPPVTTIAERRTVALRDPVTITLDGEEILADRGEPVAAALIAAGKMMLARSPKFHRPRGPACMRAACDGCLARVDETPNVMTCMIGAEDGMTVVSQNRLGPRDLDLLRMTDWFFPDGMNHHELFAGVPGVQNVMQAFARRVAGLGRLPADVEAPHAARRRTADVVVVGAGPAGMAIASRLAAAGRAVEVIDDQLVPGGGLTALGTTEAQAFDTIRAPFTDHVAAGRIQLRSSTVAGGLYGDDLLVVGPSGAEVLETRALILACGAHDGALAFEGNDVPGVMSARAAGWLLGRGVVVGKRIVVVESAGGGPFGASFASAFRASAASAKADVKVVRGEPVSIRGASRVKAVIVRDGSGKEQKHEADAVLIDAPRSPAYELAEQAGATLAHESRGFVVQTSGGKIRDGVYALGEMTGTPLEARALEREADRLAASLPSS